MKYVYLLSILFLHLVAGRASSLLPNTLPHKACPDSVRVLLRKGELIFFELANEVSSDKNLPNSTVRLKFDKNVTAQGNLVLINAGRLAMAQVTRVKRPRWFGLPGSIRIEALYVDGSDGQSVEVMDGVLEAVGHKRRLTALIALSIGIPVIGLILGFPWLLALLLVGPCVKGPEAKMKQYTGLKARVKKNTYVCP